MPHFRRMFARNCSNSKKMKIGIILGLTAFLIQSLAFPANHRHAKSQQVHHEDTAPDRIRKSSRVSSFANEPSHRRELPSRVKTFYDEYYQEKLRHPEVPLWNLVPNGYPNYKDTFANSLKALLPSNIGMSENAASRIYRFNISEISDMENIKIIDAELRIRLSASTEPSSKTETLKIKKFSVNVYQLHDPSSQQERLLIASKKFTMLPGSDVVFSVSSVAHDWRFEDVSNYGFQVDMVTDPSSEGSAVELDAAPLLVFYLSKESEWKGREEILKFEEEKRHKRQVVVPLSSSLNTSSPCGMRSVQMAVRDIGLGNKIFQPTRLTINFCSGHCHWPLTVQEATNSGKLQGRVAAITGQVPEPCCAPKTFEPLFLIEYDSSGGMTSSIKPDGKVTSCECK